MKVYSDTLTSADLRACAIAPVSIWRLDHIGGPRKRWFGWDIVLTRTSPRGRNSGRYGAQDKDAWEYAPLATWDEHGAWMANVYALDADAIVAKYKSLDDFNAKTDYAYEPTIEVTS